MCSVLFGVRIQVTPNPHDFLVQLLNENMNYGVAVLCAQWSSLQLYPVSKRESLNIIRFHTTHSMLLHLRFLHCLLCLVPFNKEKLENDCLVSFSLGSSNLDCGSMATDSQQQLAAYSLIRDVNPKQGQKEILII